MLRIRDPLTIRVSTPLVRAGVAKFFAFIFPVPISCGNFLYHLHRRSEKRCRGTLPSSNAFSLSQIKTCPFHRLCPEKSLSRKNASPRRFPTHSAMHPPVATMPQFAVYALRLGRKPLKRLASILDRNPSTSRLQILPVASRCGHTGMSASTATRGRWRHSRSSGRRALR